MHQSALDGYDTDIAKIQETKGCQMFCTGLVRQSAVSSWFLCVAIKRTIQVFELIKTRFRYRKIKDIHVPMAVQFIEMFNERLCVGYQSCFALYSIQGDGAPMSEYASLVYIVMVFGWFRYCKVMLTIVACLVVVIFIIDVKRIRLVHLNSMWVLVFSRI